MAAPGTAFFSITARRARRTETNASSLIANTPLNATSARMIATSIQGKGGRGAIGPFHLCRTTAGAATVLAHAAVRSPRGAAEIGRHGPGRRRGTWSDHGSSAGPGTTPSNPSPSITIKSGQKYTLKVYDGDLDDPAYLPHNFSGILEFGFPGSALQYNAPDVVFNFTDGYLRPTRMCSSIIPCRSSSES